MTQQQNERMKLMRESLRRKLQQGDTVYTVRLPGKGHAFLLLCYHAGEILNITGDALEACGLKRNDAFRRKGSNYNHALDTVEVLAMSLDIALNWKKLS